jgi:hypothetical protein
VRQKEPQYQDKFMAYGQSPWQQAGDAMSGVGQSMANVMLATQQVRLKAQQFMAQQALERQYLELARQKNARDTQETNLDLASRRQQMDLQNQASQRAAMIGQLQGFRGAPNPMSIVADPYNGPKLMENLRSAGTLPQGRVDLTPEQLMQAVTAAIQGQGSQSAFGTPGSAASMMSPLVMPRNSTAFDPITMMQTAQTGPGQKTPHEAEMENIQRQRTSMMDNPQERAKRVAAEILGRALTSQMTQQERLTGESNGVQDLNDMLAQLLGKSGGVSPQPVSGGGKVITDKQGKSWRYKGQMPDPTQDRNEANWEEIK